MEIKSVNKTLSLYLWSGRLVLQCVFDTLPQREHRGPMPQLPTATPSSVNVLSFVLSYTFASWDHLQNILPAPKLGPTFRETQTMTYRIVPSICHSKIER